MYWVSENIVEPGADSEPRQGFFGKLPPLYGEILLHRGAVILNMEDMMYAKSVAVRSFC